MKTIKKLFLLILLIALAAGAVQIAANRGLITLDTEQILAHTPWHSLIALPNQSSDQTLDSAYEQGTALISRSQETASQTQQILGEYVSATKSDSDQSLSEKTWEYVRYQYCKQVIQDFESNSTSLSEEN